MLKLKDQIFGGIGYSADLKLTAQELDVFRYCVNQHWLEQIHAFYPTLAKEAEQLGIEYYHLLTDRLDHKKLWTKRNRVFPPEVVERIKILPFLSILKDEFGEFTVSDMIDLEQHLGREEIYWRLVRPNVETDVGPLHKDSWFHGAVNDGYGMYTDDEITVKIWIPVFCEPGKSGLAILGGSHFKQWKYHIEKDADGYLHPVPDEDLTQAGAALVHTEPGNLLIFNENILHGGVLNQGTKTRVSAEITMVMPRAHFKEYAGAQKLAEHA